MRLLQLVSPSLPVGAYAYSQGLEQAAALGWVKDAATLEAWLLGLLRDALAWTDLPLLRHALDAWQCADSARALRLSRRILALRETSELRAEERQLGSSLARLLAGLGVERAAPFVGASHASYVVLFALAGAEYQIPPSALGQGFAFAWAENQLLGATRVLSLGQSELQRILQRVADGIPEAVAHAASVDEAELGRSAPGLFLASAWHEQQYSRLFRS